MGPTRFLRTLESFLFLCGMCLYLYCVCFLSHFTDLLFKDLLCCGNFYLLAFVSRFQQHFCFHQSALLIICRTDPSTNLNFPDALKRSAELYGMNLNSCSWILSLFFLIAFFLFPRVPFSSQPVTRCHSPLRAQQY